jgi:hypothetical protein
MFLEALELNARLITDLISELKLIIGEQPPVPELEPRRRRAGLHSYSNALLASSPARNIRWPCSSTICNGSTRRRSICWSIY